MGDAAGRCLIWWEMVGRDGNAQSDLTSQLVMLSWARNLSESQNKEDLSPAPSSPWA